MTIDFLSPLALRWLVVFVAVGVVVCLLARRLVGPPAAIARRGGLVALRVLIVGGVLALLVNPVRVEESAGTIERPEVYYLLDTSQSMATRDKASRWEEAVQTIGAAAAAQNRGTAAARISLFRFGERLAAIESEGAAADELGPLLASVKPDDADSRVVPALRQLSSRFGRSPPAAVVLFSDGRFRDADGIEAVAQHFARQKVPLHVVPVGQMARGGDIAVVAAVAPPRVRKFSTAEVQVFLRSFGYDGRRSEVRLESLGPDDEPTAVLSRLPVTLRGGVQSVSLSFRSELEGGRMRISVAPEPDEVSGANNALPVEVGVDRTKIRVLYVEGSPEAMRPVRRGDRFEYRGPHSDVQDALTADPDIECVTVVARGLQRYRINAQQGLDTTRGFPDSVAELAAFDAILLSNVPREAFTDQELEWVEQWVSRRGGGLCMIGGENAFAAGGWGGSLLEQALPVSLRTGGATWLPTPITVEPKIGDVPHPLWHLMADDRQNRAIVSAFPDFIGLNTALQTKPHLTTVLATAKTDDGTERPLLVAGQYGKGRTLAMAAATTAPWANEFLVNWGSTDQPAFSKFWRNAVYWLTENSSIGRRRLVLSADKRFYRPGETIALQAVAYDEGAARTTDYRIVAMIEPQSSLLDLDSPDSPVLWPGQLPRTSGEEGPCVAWGEEFELPRRPEQADYRLEMDVARMLASGKESQSLRVEVTAYEEDTQVDSTSVDLQILHDPFEQQNPFPDHPLLARLAAESGGQVLTTPDELADVLGDLDVKIGPPTLRKEPLWSRWPVLGMLLGLLTTEWLWRRSLGLA